MPNIHNEYEQEFSANARAMSYYCLDYFAQNNRSVWRYAAINADRNDYIYDKSQATAINAAFVICTVS